MCTLLHSHDTCIWGDIPRGLGTIVVTFKPFGETCQTGGECIDHLLGLVPLNPIVRCYVSYYV